MSRLRYCKGDNTGLVFQEEADMLAFHNILTECGYRILVAIDLDHLLCLQMSIVFCVLFACEQGCFALSQEDRSKKNGDAEA